MNGQKQLLSVASKTFQCTVVPDINEARARELYEDYARSVDLRRDALFVLRCPMAFHPLDPEHPELGSVSDDDADRSKLWHIEHCCAVESVRIALECFGSPGRDAFLSPERGAHELLGFVEKLASTRSISLNFVSEDLLNFFMLDNANESCDSAFNEIVEFCRHTFKTEMTQSVLRWMRSDYRKAGRFAIGVF